MNNRQQRIIDILHDYDEWVTGKELASMLSVSDRTIRSDIEHINNCLLYTSPSPRDRQKSRMPSSA